MLAFTQHHFPVKSCFYFFLKKSHNKFKSGAGFTLIELIIVIAIIAVIASAIFIAVDPAKRIGEAKDAQRWQDIASISQAVEQYTADHGALPSDFSSSTIGVGDKVVICDTVTTLTCDGQSRPCLIVDDTDFLGAYLPVIPYDPDKSNASDTGYYITRGSGDIMSFGICDAYAGVGIAMNSKIALPDYVAPPAAPEPAECGNGILEGSEVCDSNLTLQCAQESLYYKGGYVEDDITCNGNVACKNDCTVCIAAATCDRPLVPPPI